MEVTRCIYGRLGWHWKFIDRTRINGLSVHIEKITCEVRYAEDDQIITELRNFFFDLSNIDLGELAGLPSCGFNLGAGTGMGLPYQLGWFHFDQLADNELTQAGLGVSVAYSAPLTKATIYVYNKEIPDLKSSSTSLLEAEFFSSRNDFLAINPSAIQIAEKFDSNLFFAAFEIGSTYSIITISGVGTHFFKTRVTLDRSNEKYAFECLWESVNTILRMVSPRLNH